MPRDKARPSPFRDKRKSLLFGIALVLVVLGASSSIISLNAMTKTPSGATMFNASSSRYQPSIGDNFTFNYTKKFSAVLRQHFAVYNASTGNLLYMINITSLSEGMVTGIINMTITEVFPSADPSFFSNATVRWTLNATIQYNYIFEQVMYVVHPLLGIYMINQTSYTVPSPAKPYIDDGTGTLIYNGTYFFLGGSENGSTLVGTPSYDLSEFSRFIGQFVDENDTSLPENATNFIIPLDWTKTYGQDDYIINGQIWALNTTIFSTTVGYTINETHPAFNTVSKRLGAMLSQANVTNVNVTFSLGTLSFSMGTQATYDNATGHLLRYIDNKTSSWRDLRLNGTAEYNGSIILFNGTELSNATCQVESVLTFHSALYLPPTTTTTSIAPPASTTTTTSTLVQNATTTTTTTTTTIASNQPSSDTSASTTNATSGNNESSLTSELGTTTPSLVTPSFEATMFSVALLFSLVIIAFVRKRPKREG